jgi:hypothetical protein
MSLLVGRRGSAQKLLREFPLPTSVKNKSIIITRERDKRQEKN